jgi:DNA-binding CsgD family transcriptional regulator
MTVFDETLSSRENQCLFFIIRGKTAKEIGNILGISYRTVEEYTQSIKNKLNCKSKHELIAYSIEQGYLNVFPETLLNHSLFIAL